MVFRSICTIFVPMKKGLVLEGGAMRGLFTAGIIDVMMEAGVEPDGLIGVSAGAAFGCNYKSRQPGRAVRYNTRFAKDPRYSGLRSLIKTGDYFNAEFGYHIVPKEYDIFDTEAFEQNRLVFVFVCTDVMTGKAVYHQMDRVTFDELEWLRASASMPLASKVVEVGGRKLLDGGVADSIPLAYFERIGYERNVVILTQPEGYVKEPNRLMPLMRLALRQYPKMIEAMENRHLMYNQELEYVRQAEREGRCLVIRPDEKLPIGHISHDPENMRRVYEIGRRKGKEHLDQIIDFYSNHNA
ncbi:Predicted phospholipase, patatin/cPLA2 family [Prevotella sp. ne3005]|nr:Predicted phospholipase, patatin/cPLA2 family [Prevotella sp. ne3005]